MSNQSMRPVPRNRPIESQVESWTQCQPGTLAAAQSPFLFERLSRRMALFQMGIIYLIGMLTVYASFLAFTNQPAAEVQLPPEMSCEMVRSLLDDYADHSLCNRQIRESIAFHLANCCHCDRHYQTLIGEEVDIARRSERQSGDSCRLDAGCCHSSCQSIDCILHSCESQNFESNELSCPEDRGSELGSRRSPVRKQGRQGRVDQADQVDRIEPCIRP